MQKCQDKKFRGLFISVASFGLLEAEVAVNGLEMETMMENTAALGHQGETRL